MVHPGIKLNVAAAVKPKRSPVINIRLADERYSSWKQFLDADRR